MLCFGYKVTPQSSCVNAGVGGEKWVVAVAIPNRAFGTGLWRSLEKFGDVNKKPSECCKQSLILMGAQTTRMPVQASMECAHEVSEELGTIRSWTRRHSLLCSRKECVYILPIS